MVFSHRIAALAAVVAIPLGIAVTSYALTDRPDDRKVPPKVELPTSSLAPGVVPSPSDETVGPPVSESPSTSGSSPAARPSTPPPAPSAPSPPARPGGDDDDDGPGQDDDGPGGDDSGDDG
ncbi:hypothetical protein ACFVIM_07480 [Streptomyces sp. NPDC057638]|uniref:hypothetical protein n=1 Tax=Streptomyces sp. NPDC057638 TaxID=3346190 RepID=UPI0036C1F357